jgi:hypothetical protein
MPKTKKTYDEIEDKQNMRATKLAMKSESFIRKNAKKVNKALKRIDAPTIDPFGRPRVQHMPFCGKKAYLQIASGSYKEGTQKAGEHYSKFYCTDKPEPKKRSTSTKKRASSPKKENTLKKLKSQSSGQTAKTSESKSATKKQLSAKFTKPDLYKMAQKLGREVNSKMTKEQIVSKMKKSDFTA